MPKFMEFAEIFNDMLKERYNGLYSEFVEDKRIVRLGVIGVFEDLMSDKDAVEEE